MCQRKFPALSKRDIVGFTLPRLHRGSTWYVDFTAYDPASDRMRRKKYMLGRYRTVREREDMAAVLIHNIYHRLLAGWNPFVDSVKTRHMTEFTKVIRRYYDYVKAATAKGVFKQKTAIDYVSRMKQLELYLAECGRARYIYQFDRSFCVDFLDYLMLDKDVSARTRNNYRTWLSAFAAWLQDRQYSDANPVEDIRPLREDEKFRDPLTAEDLVRLSKYTADNCPMFHLACLMEYYTFIRPDELRHIRIGDISVERQCVRVSAKVSKNRKEMDVALNGKVLKAMAALKVFDHPSQDYLFGEKMKPGPAQVYVNQFRLEWNKVRRALSFPDSYQFYSLKDSGIRDLANAEGIVIARDQARHADITTTNKYLKNQNIVHEEAKGFEGSM